MPLTTHHVYLLWIFLPALNFFTWCYIGKLYSPILPCIKRVGKFGNPVNGGVTMESKVLDCTDLDREVSFIPISAVERSPSNSGERSQRENGVLGLSDVGAGGETGVRRGGGGRGGGGIGGLYKGIIGYKGCHPVMGPEYESPNLQFVATDVFDDYRSARLAPMTELKGGQHGFTNTTIIVRPFGKLKSFSESPDECTHYMVMTKDIHSCSAVVRLNNIGEGALNVLRYDSNIDENNLKLSTYEKDYSKKPMKTRKQYELPFIGGVHNKLADKDPYFSDQILRPVGFFRKIPKDRGHDRTREKMGPFVKHFDGPTGIENQLKVLLDSKGIKKGDDMTVMVVNEGEIDLYLNFACSCREHGIAMSNVIVFAGSSEIITIIESTGAIGIYHEGYSAVSKKASTDYLDRVFVDMMWYKAFSIFLLLRIGINILFQDADLVWFKDPFPYFHNYGKDLHGNVVIKGSENIEGFFSDDGQRSLRYSPYYANSGFYYLIANDRTTYFAWSVMTSFDAVQVLGSHQNVLTMRLVEEFSMSAKYSKILDLPAFPGGVMYHHDHAYMKRLKEGKEDPYGFHMCWTQGKADKLLYLRKVKMWYLTEECSPLANLLPDGEVFGSLTEKESHNVDLRWDHTAQLCCQPMVGAPKYEP